MPEVTPSLSSREGSPESPSKPSVEGQTYDRGAAWLLLNQYTQSSSLLKHALSVEVCVRAYGEQRATELGLPQEEARMLVETYAVTGLLHDFDYEKYPSPEEHPWIGNRILADQGWPEEVRHAIMGHAEYTHTPRISHLDKVLFACDELAGFLTANALVKPTKSIRDVNVASVLKKMKDKAFARGVNREDIVVGATELGIALPEHVAFCLAEMQQHAEELGLAGATP